MGYANCVTSNGKNNIKEDNMTHVIFDLCIRDGACVEVCPVACIIPGVPEFEWPWFYIDPDTCIDCGACIPECPVDSIRPEEDLKVEFPQYTAAIELNAAFFKSGPGYSAKT
jgi:ferredoxin